MEVDPKVLDKMFRFAGLNKAKLHEALIHMGPKMLNKPWDKKWSKERPTTGYCYVVSEFVFHYLAPPGCKVMRLYVPETDIKHWFIQWPDETIVDLTMDQFDNVPDYSKAKGAGFLTKEPSKRAKVLAELLGYSDEDLDGQN
jgi:hypothetical protein